MPSRTIVERLRAGDVLLMDGATGTELSRRGVNTHQGYAGPMSETELEEGFKNLDQGTAVRSTPRAYLDETDPAEMRRVHEENLRQLGPWSAPANLEAPEVLRQIHEDYLRVGAEILITNNFFASRSKLARIGQGDDWEQYARAGARIAIETRDEHNPEAYVAGGIAPPAEREDLRPEFAEQSKVLADEGVDFLLPEYLGAIDECVTAVEACSAVGLPILIGVRNVSDTGTMQYLETFDDLSRALDGLPVDGILLMCHDMENIPLGLRNLRAAYDGPIGAYPHPPRDAPDVDTELELFAAGGREWIDLGAQIVGGCCVTTPDHIAALAPIVEELRAG